MISEHYFCGKVYLKLYFFNWKYNIFFPSVIIPGSDCEGCHTDISPTQYPSVRNCRQPVLLPPSFFLLPFSQFLLPSLLLVPPPTTPYLVFTPEANKMQSSDIGILECSGPPKGSDLEEKKAISSYLPGHFGPGPVCLIYLRPRRGIVAGGFIHKNWNLCDGMRIFKVHRYGTKGSKLPDVVYSFACCSFCRLGHSFRIPLLWFIGMSWGSAFVDDLAAACCSFLPFLLSYFFFILSFFIWNRNQNEKEQSEMNASQ